ncbi:MAG: hypothetical protein M1827_004774 [Pycnora praestabilis]|nr:MAG: hypothetical protein M1827_004774 [Pycnora praestabilis]
MGDRYRRPISPGSRRLATPLRSSTGSVVYNPSFDPYYPPPRSSRELISSPRSSGDRVLDPTRAVPHRSVRDDSGITGNYVSRPRRATLEAEGGPSRRPLKIIPPSDTVRARPIIHGGTTLGRPSSPLAKARIPADEGDYYVTPARTNSNRQHRRIYSVDSNDVVSKAQELQLPDKGRERLDRGAYRHTGLSEGRSSTTKASTARQSDSVDDGYGYSYTDPREQMYRDTAPRPRPRPRDGTRPKERPISMTGIEDYAPRGSISRDSGPPPTTRGLDKLDRSSSVKHRPRTSADDARDHPNIRDEQYYDSRSRSSARRPIALDQPHDDDSESYSGSYSEDYDDYRDRQRSARPYDDEVEARGFGIRNEAADRLMPLEEEATRGGNRRKEPRFSDLPIKEISDEPLHEMDRRRREPRVTGTRERNYSDDDLRDRERRRTEPREREDRRREVIDDEIAQRDIRRTDLRERDPRERDPTERDPRERDPRERDPRERDPRERDIKAREVSDEDEDEDYLRDKERRRKERRERREMREREPQEREPQERDDRDREASDEDEVREHERRRKERRERKKRERDALLEIPADPRDVDPRELGIPDGELRERDPADRDPREVDLLERDLRDREVREKEVRDSEFRERGSQRALDDDEPLVREPFEAQEERSTRVRIQSPSTEKESEAPIKGILRPPREKFPEEPEPIREGVAPLKDAGKKGIPVGARWTKIDRKLVNPAALEEAHERFEERENYVIVLRVLSKEDIQKYAEKTQEIRDARYEQERKDRRRRRDDDRDRDIRSIEGREADGPRAIEPPSDSRRPVIVEPPNHPPNHPPARAETAPVDDRLRENPEAPGTYVGYRRNPPAPRQSQQYYMSGGSGR